MSIYALKSEELFCCSM